MDGTPEPVHGHDHGHEHEHHAGHSHPHGHEHGHHHPHTDAAVASAQDPSPGSRTVIPLEVNLLAKNDLLAARNRGWLEGRGIRAFNVMSSPGAGKTTLLVRTIGELAGQLEVGVIEGDQETSLDADRIRATGRPVIQINTGAGCHLDAGMLQRGLAALDPGAGSTIFIENVGNLVCPALFDLGESARVVIISVTEGDDKPQKYPHMFLAADLVIINKSDLLPYVDFDVEECSRQARLLNPGVDVLTLSASSGDGMESWLEWIRKNPGPVANPGGVGTRSGLGAGGLRV